MSLKSQNLSWSERIAIIDKFNLTNDQATTVFGVTTNEIMTARNLQQSGKISPVIDFDFSKYEDELNKIKRPDLKREIPSITKPVTATKPSKEPKKRGRKGDKIVCTLRSVPSEPTSAEQFASDHNVSLAVLRQAKRFDTTGLPGDVKVRKDKASGVLMIWREVETLPVNV